MNRFTCCLLVTLSACPSGSDIGDDREDHGTVLPEGAAGVATSASGGAANSSSSSTGTATTVGHGGAGGHEQATATSSVATTSTSVVATSAATTAETSSSSGIPEPVDCTTAPHGTPCEEGACAPDGVCRTLARCRVKMDGRWLDVSCLDDDVRRIISFYNEVSYNGCVSFGPERIDLISCVPGEQCWADITVGVPSTTRRTAGYCY
jgi:hypothetical protein